MKKGVLLLNLGTPNSPRPNDVGEFLSEFLMDKEVIPAPWPIRWFLVKGLIVPRRKYASAKNYEKIWMKNPEMSPILFHSLQLKMKLHQTLGVPVELGMRYGNPSIAAALKSLNDQGCEQVTVFPLFPQYSTATTKTAFDWVKKQVSQLKLDFEFHWVESYFNHNGFIKAQKSQVHEAVANKIIDHYVFSFHGLPESFLKKSDPTKGICLQMNDCCSKACEGSLTAISHCYRAQCFATAKELAKDLQLPSNQWSMSFQSRLGPNKWTGPYTSEVILKLAKDGVKNVAVACPSFTSDCLETLEEIGMGLKKEFLNAGGESFTLVPCVNARDEWVQSIVRMIN